MPLPDYPVGTLLRLSWRVPHSPEFQAMSITDDFVVRVAGPVRRHITPPSGDPFDNSPDREHLQKWVQVEYVSGTAYRELDTSGRRMPIETSEQDLRYLWLNIEDDEVINHDYQNDDGIFYGRGNGPRELPPAEWHISLSNTAPVYLDEWPEDYRRPIADYERRDLRYRPNEWMSQDIIEERLSAPNEFSGLGCTVEAVRRVPQATPRPRNTPSFRLEELWDAPPDVLDTVPPRDGPPSRMELLFDD